MCEGLGGEGRVHPPTVDADPHPVIGEAVAAPVAGSEMENVADLQIYEQQMRRQLCPVVGRAVWAQSQVVRRMWVPGRVEALELRILE